MNVYAFHIDVFGSEGWYTARADEGEFAGDPDDTARGLAEDWVIDHPETLHGGERVRVHRGDPGEHPIDGFVSVRVQVFRGPLASHDPEPSATADLEYIEAEH